jgi:hypothetical protein
MKLASFLKHCNNCDRSISILTYEEYDGLCVRCFAKKSREEKPVPDSDEIISKDEEKGYGKNKKKDQKKVKGKSKEEKRKEEEKRKKEQEQEQEEEERNDDEENSQIKKELAKINYESSRVSCSECKRIYSEGTISKYEGVCGRCFSRDPHGNLSKKSEYTSQDISQETPKELQNEKVKSQNKKSLTLNKKSQNKKPLTLNKKSQNKKFQNKKPLNSIFIYDKSDSGSNSETEFENFIQNSQYVEEKEEEEKNTCKVCGNSEKKEVLKDFNKLCRKCALVKVTKLIIED